MINAVILIVVAGVICMIADTKIARESNIFKAVAMFLGTTALTVVLAIAAILLLQ